MTIQECVSVIKDVLLAIAGVTTSWVALRGLETWRRELRGTANFEVARGLSRATYKLRDQLNRCRTQIITKEEFPEWYLSEQGNLYAYEKSNAYRHTYSARWAYVYEALQEFDAQTLEAEALWGTQIREKTNLMREALQRLRAAIEAYIDDVASNGQTFKSDPEFGKKIQSDLYELNFTQPNELSNEIRHAISAIEDELKPHLKR